MSIGISYRYTWLLKSEVHKSEIDLYVTDLDTYILESLWFENLIKEITCSYSSFPSSFFSIYRHNPECTSKNREVPYNKNVLLFRSVPRYGHMLNYVLYFHIHLSYTSQCFWAQTLRKQVESPVWLYRGNQDQVLVLVLLSMSLSYSPYLGSLSWAKNNVMSS